MPVATVGGLALSYDVIGDSGPAWTLTPGGRFSKDYPGVRELAEALAAEGNRVLIWDRPNTGASHVCFDGPTESDMQADALASLVRHLDLAPAIIAGGSGGSRISLLTAARHRDVARGLAVWWISGGVFGSISLGTHYCGPSLGAAWHGGMEAVVELPEWSEVLERNLDNRQRFLDRDPQRFIETMERWMLVYCPCGDDVVAGLSDEEARAVDLPALVFRSGASDLNHPRVTSERVAEVLPNAELVEPPWPDTEWNDRQADGSGLFVRWHLLAPTLTEWARRAVPGP